MSGFPTYQALEPNRDKFDFAMRSLKVKRWQNLAEG
jgi:hypothetical protein